MEDLARSLLRRMRGARTCAELSRRLGYRSNVAVRWDRGEQFPTLGELFRGVMRLGLDLPAVLRQFHPASADAFDRARPLRVWPWLSAVCAGRTRAYLMEKTGFSRFQLGRLLNGRGRGRLPVALALIDAATGRAAELAGLLTDDADAKARAELRERQTAWALAHPWGPAVVAVVSTLPDGADPVDGLIAALPLDREAAAAELHAARAAGWPRAAVPVLPSDQRTLNAHWGRVLAARATASGADDAVHWLTVAVSRGDLARIQALQRRHLRDVRAIAAQSTPEVAAEIVVASLVWR